MKSVTSKYENRVKLSEKKTFFMAGILIQPPFITQKVDVHHANRSKAEELGARRLQRPKIF